MSNRIKRIIRSVSSASSKASSDRSYADTYFEEIGFKLGDNSCLGSAESPDNLDGDQILFHKEDKLFYESDEDDVMDEDDVYNDDESVHHDYNEDQKSQDTATASNHKYLSPPVGLSKEDIHNGKQDQHVRSGIMTLPMDYVVQENRKSKTRLNNSFGSNGEEAIVFHHNDDYRHSKNMKYSPSRPHPITTLGAHDNDGNKLDTGRSNKTWFFNLDSVVIGETDFLHKSTSHSIESYRERAFRVKATIWFLFFLGTFFLISSIVVLMLAFEQGRQAEFDRARNSNNKDMDSIDQDDAFLTPLAEGWEIEDELSIDWNFTTRSPSSRNTEAPTVRPTDAPTNIFHTTSPPTKSPTTLFTAAQAELVETLVAASNDPDLKRSIKFGSPQFHAVQWLADDPFLAAYSANRVLQRWAVATFYFSTNGDAWQIDNNNGDQAVARQFNKNPWMIPTTNECWWFTSHDKEICDGKGRLETLSLNGIGLKGSLPDELGFLTTLKHISLPNNHIEGSIPHTFGRLTLLESLELQHNKLSHELPLELGNLEALKEFKANGNKLEGSIPVELFSMLDLETLNLQSNKISGEIPTALAALPNLKELTIQNNEIVGTMPFETCHLTHLIADCDEMICECCTQCCIGCKGSIGQIVDTTGTEAPTESPTRRSTPGPTSAANKVPTKAPTRTPTAAPTRTPTVSQPTTKKPTSKPTSIPTRTPTQAPTRKPTTNKPTSPPTKQPAAEPTATPTRNNTTRPPINTPTATPTQAQTAKPFGPAPEGIHILVSVGNDGIPERLYPLKMCQGDCDRDQECEGDLVCYERNGVMRVPGCLGQGAADRDYCTHPQFIAEAEAGGENIEVETEADNGAKPALTRANKGNN